MAQDVFDHCVIGSGIAALGAVSALADRGITNFCVITDDRSDLQQYDPPQILRFLGQGGTSNYWHGVIPSVPETPLRRDLFTRFFDHDPNLWLRENIFVPKTPLHSWTHLHGQLTAEQHIKDQADSLIPGATATTVTLKGGRHIKAGQVWCGAGVLGSLGILHRSSLSPAKVTVGDHICGFVGMLNAQQAAQILKTPVTSTRGHDGYSVPCWFSADQKTLFTLRPARLEMRRPDRQNRGGPKFAMSKGQVIWGLLKSGSLGRLSEAVALKTGQGFQADHYAVHFQHECRETHICDVETETLRPIYQKEAILEQVSKATAPTEHFPTVPDQDLYYGTHLFGAKGLPELPAGIDVIDSTCQISIGGGHHSFSQLVQAYDMVQNSK